MIPGNFLKNQKMGKRLSTFCVQKMPEIDFPTPKSLENQLEWPQFSEIIVGSNYLRHHPITCRSIHNLLFFGSEKTTYGVMDCNGTRATGITATFRLIGLKSRESRRRFGIKQKSQNQQEILTGSFGKI